MQNEKGIPAGSFSQEHDLITDFTEAGSYGTDFRGKVTTRPEQLDGEQVLV
jgi:hypothetical protein